MKHTLIRLSPLVAVLVLALIPYGWFTLHSAPFAAFMNMLFATEAAHAVGHSLIFVTVGVALLMCFPTLLQRPARYLVLILAVALGQEGFQLLYKGRGVVLNDVTDIGTDLVAAMVVILIARRTLRHLAHEGRERPAKHVNATGVGDAP